MKKKHMDSEDPNMPGEGKNPSKKEIVEDKPLKKTRSKRIVRSKSGSTNTIYRKVSKTIK